MWTSVINYLNPRSTVPAVFAIGQDGIIAFAYANPDYKIRLPADELLQVVERLAAGK